MADSSNKAWGARIFQDIDSEMCSLEYILNTVRSKFPSKHFLPYLPLDLTKLCQSKTQKSYLAIKCNYMTAATTALINHIITYQLTIYCGAVLLLDFSGNFTISHLKDQCGISSLNHLYVFRLRQSSARLEEIRQWMLFGDHMSHNKEWVGTIIIGSEGVGEWNGCEKVLVSCGWNGWINVVRDKPKAYPEGISVEEAWKNNLGLVQIVSWKAWCEEGEYKWT